MATILRRGKPNQARGASTPGAAIVLHPAFGAGKSGFGKSAFSFGKGFGFEKAPGFRKERVRAAKGAAPAVVLQMKPGQAARAERVAERVNELAGLDTAPPPRRKTVAGDGIGAMRGLAAALTIYLIMALGALACVVAWRFYH